MRLATITFNLSMAFNPGELKNIANIKKKIKKWIKMEVWCLPVYGQCAKHALAHGIVN